uniref:Uncharacterized protein n=1 Tax=Rhizophora mucronata TaxID=61149 RepID=A0A2P2Q063_RHIMU
MNIARFLYICIMHSSVRLYAMRMENICVPFFPNFFFWKKVYWVRVYEGTLSYELVME